MNTIETIRAEVERRKKYLIPQKGQGVVLCEEIRKQLDSLLSFLSDLEKSEKPMEYKNIDTEIGHWMSCLDDKYCMLVNHYSIQDIKDTARHFAEWGAEHAREKMMKEAIHYVVQDDLDSHGASYNIPFIRIGTIALKPKGIGVGDKVRIIIVKED